MKFPKHAASLSLTHNDHKASYQTVEESIVIHDDQGVPHTVDDEHVIFKAGNLHVTDKVWEALKSRTAEKP